MGGLRILRPFAVSAAQGDVNISTISASPRENGFTQSARRSPRRNPPDHVPHIIGYEQSTAAVDYDADRPPVRFTILAEESGEDVFRFAGGTTVRERDEDHLVSAARATIPGSMLPNDRAVAESIGKKAGVVSKGQPKGTGVWSQGVVGG